MKIKCPRCKKEFEYFDSKQRPFCSKLCKLEDLSQWASQSYKISSSLIADEDIDSLSVKQKSSDIDYDDFDGNQKIDLESTINFDQNAKEHDSNDNPLFKNKTFIN